MDENLITEELEKLNSIYQMVAEFFVNYSFQLLGAALIMLLGFFVASRAANLLLTLFEKKHLDVTLAGFAASGVKLLIIAVFLIIALGKIGISIGPFVAALGAVSLGAGLALQGTLSNYGAGVTLIITRPFVVGDTISLGEVSGIVKQVKLSHTILVDEDGVEYTIPNKHIVGEIIANSHADSLIAVTVDIAYSDDPQAACETIRKALASLKYLSDKRDALVGVDQFADSGITLAVRFWAPTEHLFEARYEANKIIHTALQQGGFNFPFPQREVRML
jgi:small conductance mechanosensitive channel